MTRTVTVVPDHLVLQVLNPKVPSQSRNAEVKTPLVKTKNSVFNRGPL